MATDPIQTIMPVTSTDSSKNAALNQQSANNPQQNAGSSIAPSLSSVPQITQTAHSNTVSANAAQAAPADLVENRVSNIIDTNSPLMQLAASRASQAANDRGLLNSSLAVGAAQNAVMDAATPIATADSNAINQNNQFNAANRQQVNLQNATQAQRTSELNTAADNAAIGTNTENQMRTNLANLDVSSKAFLDSLDNKTKQQIQTSANAATLFNSYSQQAAAIMTSPNLDAAGKQQALANLQTLLKDGIAAQDAVSGLNISSIVLNDAPVSSQPQYTVTANSSNNPNQPPTGYAGFGRQWTWNSATSNWTAQPVSGGSGQQGGVLNPGAAVAWG